jgi:ribonucleoside-triphosphate reductase (thioredoxin)
MIDTTAIEIMSDIISHMKYARYLPSQSRRETWTELTLRSMEMHMNKFPKLKDEIAENFSAVLNKEVLPSMRSLQFAGKAIELMPNRMFNCLTADTKFITTKGVKSFFDYVDGQEVEVFSHQGIVRKAVVRHYGRQSVDRITFSRGKTKRSIRATANHSWLLGEEITTTSLSIKDILIGTPRLYKNFDYENASPFEKLYWCYGFVFGDGTIVNSGNGQYSMVRLCGDDSKYLNRFEEMGFQSSRPLSCNGDPIVYTGKYLKTVPSVDKDSLDLIRAFLYGYLAADGEKNPDWYDNNELSPYKSIQSSQADHIEFLEWALEVCGFYILTKTNLTGQETNFGVRGETYKFSLTTKIGSEKHPNMFWSVTAIEKNIAYEEVWCLEVEEDHSFILSGGIITGNCSYLPMNHPKAFSEVMFLLLGGSGVGYSVQRHHVKQLPFIRKPVQPMDGRHRNRRVLIADSIEGWADAINTLVNIYFNGEKDVDFDFRDIRQKGALLVTSGGKAPGPQPLKDCIHNIRKIFDSALEERGNGTYLKTIEVHDMVCFLADAVLSGGIRRSACISFFSIDDEDMLTCKYNHWYEHSPQRARANNSAVIVRHKVHKDDFMQLWEKISKSGSGEPGIFFTNDAEVLANPCVEISLIPNSFCNLTTIHAGTVKDQEDLNRRARIASFIGTLQASYTNFHYLRDVWQENAEKENLLGVSMTGIASGPVMNLNLTEAAKVVLKENRRIAKLIDVGESYRTTCVKPEGTTSSLLVTSSGIHAWHNDYYIRRFRVGKNEAIYSYLKDNSPELLEDDYFKPNLQAVISIPVKAPEGAILRTESPLQLLERVKKFSTEWIRPGHKKGSNYNNVSTTVSIKENEWEVVGNWMWENKEFYNGLSVLPYDTSGTTYVQTPFEDISKEEYEQRVKTLRGVDVSKIKEITDDTNPTGEVSCAGGACEIL